MIRDKLRNFTAAVMVPLLSACELAWAAPSWQMEVADLARASIQPVIFDPSRLDIPLESVTLKEVHQGTSGELIIHIQDAHMNLSGQKNLSDAVDHLMKRYDLDLVMVEGASRDSSLGEVRKMASLKDWKIIARRFLFDGVISGEEYLNLTTEHPMKILGVEYRDLYEESVKAYGALVDRRDDVLQYLYRVRTAVDRIKAKNYPEELLEYEKQKARLADDGDFKTRFENLLTLTQKARVGLDDFREIQKLLIIRQKESGIRFEQANREQARLFEKLQKSGEEQTVREYIKNQRRLRNTQLSHGILLGQLLSFAKKKGLSPEEFPELAVYEAYLKEFAGLHAERLFNELELLEDRVFTALLVTDDAKIVRAIDRFTALLGQAYRLQMSSKDYALFEANQEDLRTESWLAFLNDKLSEAGFFESLLPYRPLLESGQGDLDKFYRLVNERDQSFVQNARKLMQSHRQKAAVLIAGGYHTAHLTELFKKEGISYIVLTPVVTEKTDHAKYEKVLLARLARHEKALVADPSAKPFEPQAATSKVPRGLRPESWIESFATPGVGGRMPDWPELKDYLSPQDLSAALFRIAASRLSNGDAPQDLAALGIRPESEVGRYLLAHPGKTSEITMMLSYFSPETQRQMVSGFGVSRDGRYLAFDASGLPWRPWMADPGQERRLGLQGDPFHQGLENRWYRPDDPAIELQLLDEGFLISEGRGMRNPVFLGRVGRKASESGGSRIELALPYPVVIKRGASLREVVLAQILSRLRLIDFEGVIREGDQISLVTRFSHGRVASVADLPRYLRGESWNEFAKELTRLGFRVETAQYMVGARADQKGVVTLIDAGNLEPLANLDATQLRWAPVLTEGPNSEQEALRLNVDPVLLAKLDAVGNRLVGEGFPGAGSSRPIIIFDEEADSRAEGRAEAADERANYDPILSPVASAIREVVLKYRQQREARTGPTRLFSETGVGKELIHQLEYFANMTSRAGEQTFEILDPTLRHEQAVEAHGRILHTDLMALNAYLERLAQAIERGDAVPPVLPPDLPDAEQLRVTPMVGKAIAREGAWTDLLSVPTTGEGGSLESIAAIRDLLDKLEPSVRFYRDYARNFARDYEAVANELFADEPILRDRLRVATGLVPGRVLLNPPVPTVESWTRFIGDLRSRPVGARSLNLIRFGMGALDHFELTEYLADRAVDRYTDTQFARFVLVQIMLQPNSLKNYDDFAAFYTTLGVFRRLLQRQINSVDDSQREGLIDLFVREFGLVWRQPSASRLSGSDRSGEFVYSLTDGIRLSRVLPRQIVAAAADDAGGRLAQVAADAAKAGFREPRLLIRQDARIVGLAVPALAAVNDRASITDPSLRQGDSAVRSALAALESGLRNLRKFLIANPKYPETPVTVLMSAEDGVLGSEGQRALLAAASGAMKRRGDVSFGIVSDGTRDGDWNAFRSESPESAQGMSWNADLDFIKAEVDRGRKVVLVMSVGAADALARRAERNPEWSRYLNEGLLSFRPIEQLADGRNQVNPNDRINPAAFADAKILAQAQVLPDSERESFFGSFDRKDANAGFGDFESFAKMVRMRLSAHRGLYVGWQLPALKNLTDALLSGLPARIRAVITSA